MVALGMVVGDVVADFRLGFGHAREIAAAGSFGSEAAAVYWLPQPGCPTRPPVADVRPARGTGPRWPGPRAVPANDFARAAVEPAGQVEPGPRPGKYVRWPTHARFGQWGQPGPAGYDPASGWARNCMRTAGSESVVRQQPPAWPCAYTSRRKRQVPQGAEGRPNLLRTGPRLKVWSKSRIYQLPRPDHVPESHLECVNGILIA